MNWLASSWLDFAYETLLQMRNVRRVSSDWFVANIYDLAEATFRRGAIMAFPDLAGGKESLS